MGGAVQTVTIRDVAQKAGVSVATVSRAFNGGTVKETTRRRVVEAADHLCYSPSSAARTLITHRTLTIGVLLPDLHGEFFSEVIRGIDLEAQRHRYHLLVSSSHSDKSEIEAAMRAMRGSVDGLILMSPHLDARTLRANVPPHLPVVLLNGPIEDDRYDGVEIDNFGGARAMTRHLLARGHCRIAFVCGPGGNRDADERLRGYRVALEAGGIQPRPEWEAAGDFTEAGGYRAARALLKGRPQPTALFAANDSMAIGALSAVHESGLAVPFEIAVAGFDDIPIARYVIPPLSSVRVPIGGLGRRATAKLIRAVEEKNEHVKKSEILPTKLIVRASTGGVRRGRRIQSAVRRSP